MSAALDCAAMGVSVGQILRQAALRAPARIALCDAGHVAARESTHTYAELDRVARRIAAGLLARGLSPGQAVALCGENSAELVAAWFGIVYAGAVIVPVSILSAAPEILQRVTHARVAFVVHDAARAALCARAVDLPGAAVRCIALAELMDVAIEPLADPLDTSPASPALLLHTSGTTGKPKAAEISHASLLLHTTWLTAHSLRLAETDVVLCTLPLSHSYGIRMAMLAPLYANARIVMVPRFDAGRTLALARAHAVTWLPAVPTMFAAWAELHEPARLPALRWALSAGAPLPDELARRAEACLGAEVRQGYGLTEATFSTLDAPPDARVLGSVGKPAWGVMVRVVDEAGRDLPAGEHGEVLVRGHNVMTCYWDDPDSSREVLSDGWLRSGDLGRLDADGRLWIVDRLKDLVIRGGYNVYPSEVEDVLAGHPDVAEVAVIGRPDARYGEEIVAVIVPRAGRAPDVQALAARVRERLSRTKLPREYAFVEKLPEGGSGKVQKRELRAWLAEGRLQVVAVQA